ncbi:hypothetical protein GCM10025881_07050 [Pseudolysinimonas kribbensis]|uniref:Uncharacterized protein n=1 Tax=Pseudolysinimonas kribbensis TaxID=433641 RepID=A0ABQ6JZY5_9MICO|nr:hypothetical protein GCM10025881_07050 [Pseudolysinimonas kribbensis]
MELAVGADQLTLRVEGDDGVRHALQVAGEPFDHPGDQVDAELARQLRQRPHERTVQRLGVLDRLGAGHRAGEVGGVLREHHEKGTAIRRVPREPLDALEVRLLVGARRELGDRDRHGGGRRRGHALSLGGHGRAIPLCGRYAAAASLTA